MKIMEISKEIQCVLSEICVLFINVFIKTIFVINGYLKE